MPCRALDSGVSHPADFTPLCILNIGVSERAFVEECFQEGWVSAAAPLVERSERPFAATLVVAHAVATASGTAAL